jgi:DNA repair protein RecN (Recombination protein N)
MPSLISRHSPAAAAGCRSTISIRQDGLLLRRVLDANGRSRAYLNGSPVTVQQLREVAESLVDIHGQHAHQSLLRSDAQRAARFACPARRPCWRKSPPPGGNWREARSRLDHRRSGIEALAAEREQLDWQLANCRRSASRPKNGWLLNDEHKRLAHAASLVEGAQFSLQVLAEGDAACEAQVASVANRLDGLSEYDPALSEVAVLLQSAQAELSEAISALRRYANRVELDPQRLVEVESASKRSSAVRANSAALPTSCRPCWRAGRRD